MVTIALGSQSILSPHHFPTELQMKHVKALLEGCCRIHLYLHCEMEFVLSCHVEHNYSLKAGL